MQGLFTVPPHSQAPVDSPQHHISLFVVAKWLPGAAWSQRNLFILCFPYAKVALTSLSQLQSTIMELGRLQLGFEMPHAN